MKPSEKLAIAFFAILGVLSLAALTVPAIREGHFRRGLFEGAPTWVMLLIAFCCCVGFITVGLLNARRRRRGQPPL